MFNKGDKIFYGQTGVCVVEEISEKVLTKNLKRRYYTLKPMYQQNNIIYAPVESDKVFMREIISTDDAENLIKNVPEIYNKVLNGEEKSDYQEYVESHSCEKLLELAVILYSKKQSAKRMKKKLGFIDEKYLKRAEELLFGELAAVLEIAPEQVPERLFAEIRQKK